VVACGFEVDAVADAAQQRRTPGELARRPVRRVLHSPLDVHAQSALVHVGLVVTEPADDVPASDRLVEVLHARFQQRPHRHRRILPPTDRSRITIAQETPGLPLPLARGPLDQRSEDLPHLGLRCVGFPRGCQAEARSVGDAAR
jgi:hypothetical protein